MNAITTYFRESLEELRHIRWPTRQQAVRFSIVVIAFVAVCAVFFGFIDIALTEIVKYALDLAL